MILALISIALLAAVAVSLAVVLPGDRGGSGNGYAGSSLPAELPIRPFALHDEGGRPVTLEALRGQPALLTFLYTNCRDICPLTAQQIRGALDLTGRDVPVVAVSVDPKGDTPRTVRKWLSGQQLQGRITWGLGTEAALQRVWRDYGVAPQTARGDHSAYVFLLDRDGRRCVSWPVSQITPEGLHHDLALILARGGRCRT